ncbi:MAG TPA: amidohydrolase family protein [Acidimicrobiia bacterium]|nr:amidohydrolase family protein [Acidimicrobiia bacterium]
MTSTPELGSRGVYLADVEQSLPYRVFDADHHFYPPADALTRHMPADIVDRVFQGGESRLVPDEEGEVDVAHERRTIGVHTQPEGGHGGVDLSEIPEMDGNIPIPGAMLNKLNPMRDLDQLSRADLVTRYNEMRPAFEMKDPRLTLMDAQGVEAAVLHAVGGGWHGAFARGDVEAGYAAVRAFNEWLFEDWGYAHANRIFIPVPIPLYDVDYAVAELERVLDLGARIINLDAGPAGYGRSPFDPYFDPYWARIDESIARIAVHLGGGNYQKHGADWSENPDDQYHQFDAFQWVAYWSDRPIMDTVTAMMFHNFFGRFPNTKVLIAEFGTVWVPYLLRKLDHATMLGRRPKWGTLPGRPSGLFKDRCIIAPYPEENLSRPMEVLGTDCLVFGSDFPHSEGLPDPMQYVTQLRGLDDDVVRKIMRDNLANWLGAS